MNQIEKAKKEVAKKCNCKICKKFKKAVNEIVITRDYKETIQARILRDPEFKKAMLAENKKKCKCKMSKDDGWDKVRKLYRNLHPIRYKIQQILDKIKKINLLDLTGATVILCSLYLVTIDPIFWLLYSAGCIIWVYLMYNKKLYFGLAMNVIAGIIGVVNYIRSLL